MIFLTVGTQLPFLRLTKIVDSLAKELQLNIKAQIGDCTYIPGAISSQNFYPPDDLDNLFNQAEVVISHAGMGTIINCLRLKKTIILFPRMAKFGEHRNDHQLDTVSSFEGVKGLYIATNEQELKQLLENYRSLESPVGLETPEREQLVEYLSGLI
ncbi:glycosyltransferase [Vibrio salinus]|uniref:glycosyltransferase n=1 Tax=Vibrio salinus TaxID=2899784 RepID=UPI001E610B7F|nr:glycosyltransferase [Vibrio salinus]MCE0493298.1 hypothetical protein [Vibrio salinus]